jgi:hypothetical protein
MSRNSACLLSLSLWVTVEEYPDEYQYSLRARGAGEQAKVNFLEVVCLTCIDIACNMHDITWKNAESSSSTRSQRRCRSRNRAQSKFRPRTRSSTKLGSSIFTPGKKNMKQIPQKARF